MRDKLEWSINATTKSVLLAPLLRGEGGVRGRRRDF